jgi:hypothetical protein
VLLYEKNTVLDSSFNVCCIKQLDACTDGGTVYIPKGTFVSGDADGVKFTDVKSVSGQKPRYVVSDSEGVDY